MPSVRRYGGSDKRGRQTGSLDYATNSFGKNLPKVPKRLELDSIAAAAGEEHGGLFARLALEAGVWLDDKPGAWLSPRLKSIHMSEVRLAGHRDKM